MYSLSNTILSGYTQMNQMRAMLAASGNSKLSAISGVSNVTSSTANKLDADSAAFLKDYQKQMTALKDCLSYTSPSPRDRQKSRMPSSA